MILSIMLWFNILESSNVAKHDAEHLPIVMIIEKRVKCSKEYRKTFNGFSYKPYKFYRKLHKIVIRCVLY